MTLPLYQDEKDKKDVNEDFPWWRRLLILVEQVLSVWQRKGKSGALFFWSNLLH